MNEAEVHSWNEFGRELKRRARWEPERIDSALKDALEALASLEGEEREGLLRVGRRVAERSSKLAAAFLRVGPRGVASLDPAARPLLIRWAFILAAHSRETLIDFLGRSPEVLGPLSEAERAVFLPAGLRLAEADPSVSYRYFLSLPGIRRDVPGPRFRSWFEEGLSLLPRSVPSALAYFGMESRRSRDSIRKGAESVSLEEVCRPLKLFAQALCGRPLGLRPLADLQGGMSRAWGPLPCTDGEAIYLPDAMRDYPTRELNFLAFKLAAAHQAGRVEFGTFSLRLSAVQDLFPPGWVAACLRGISERGKEISPLEAFFQLFPRQGMARDLFHVLEGARVEACLRREYGGLRGEMERFVPLAMEGRPPLLALPLKEALLESLLRFALLGEPVPPRLRALLGGGEGEALWFAPLLRPGAAVRDSARAAVLLYRRLDPLPNFSLSHPVLAGGDPLPVLDLPHSGGGGVDPAPRLLPGEEPYRNLGPPPHWGDLRPDLGEKKLRLRQVQSLLGRMEAGAPLSPEALKALLEKELEGEVRVSEGGEGEEFQGLFLTDLKGVKAPGGLRDGPRQAGEKLRAREGSLTPDPVEEAGEGEYFYDEWDWRLGDYRVRWCRLRERELECGTTEFVERTLQAHSGLIAQIRRQFQMLKPERFKKIPRLERGEEIDLDAAIEAWVDLRAGHFPSEKIYIEKNRKDRDFSTLFLLDMSASTDERVGGKAEGPGLCPPEEEKKVIDIEKEALVVMAEALREIGDEYAIFGFSGYGRKEVDFYAVKGFSEPYGEAVKGRIEKIRPQRSTRMGTAIRHAAHRMAGRESKVKNLILISDGYPQDYDYGEDRAGREYALKDTTAALEEAARKNIHVFCITVDRAGNDYLRRMLPPSRYLVIEETAALPRELPKIYRRLTT